MSAFMVSNKTINRIVTFMAKPSNFLAIAMEAPRDNKGAFGSFPHWDTTLFCEGLGQAMHDLNVESLKHRYDDRAEKMLGPDYEYQEETANPSQVVMSLACWIYQCSEGHVGRSKLYNAMKQFRIDLIEALFTSTAEYQDAEWG